jgi:hypothetical protein
LKLEDLENTLNLFKKAYQDSLVIQLQDNYKRQKRCIKESSNNRAATKVLRTTPNSPSIPGNVGTTRRTLIPKQKKQVYIPTVADKENLSAPFFNFDNDLFELPAKTE